MMHFVSFAVAIVLLQFCVAHAKYDFDHYSNYLTFRNKIVGEVMRKQLSMCLRETLEQSADAVYYLWTNNIPGDISEFGVYTGGASIVMMSVLFYLEPDTTRKSHMFDSFEGHPNYRATADKDFDLTQYSGQIVAPIQGVIAALKSFGFESHLEAKRIILHKGWFKDTVPHLHRPLALIRADGDAYTSTMDILNNAYKHLAVGGLVIVDDYDHYQSCRNAISDFFKAENISMSALVKPGDTTKNGRPLWTKAK